MEIFLTGLNYVLFFSVLSGLGYVLVQVLLFCIDQMDEDK